MYEKCSCVTIVCMTSSMYSLVVYLSFTLGLCLTSIYPTQTNDRPIIGIPSLKITDKRIMRVQHNLKGKAYIAASYVKFVEMGGMRVVPIMQGLNKTELRKIFDSINGLLLSGGEVNLETSGYYKTGLQLFKWAIEANENGDYFPILGICRGMQALSVFTEGSLSPLSLTDAKGYATTMDMVIPKNNTKMMSRISDDLIDAAAKLEITPHYHKYGITLKDFQKHKKTSERYRVISTSTDKNGKEFISLLEGKKLPFYGIQFHPEKTIFEWNPTSRASHHPKAIELSQYFANFFASEVRKNTRHKFKNTNEELKYLIYRYNPMMSAKFFHNDYYFQQMYVFGKKDDPGLDSRKLRSST